MTSQENRPYMLPGTLGVRPRHLMIMCMLVPALVFVACDNRSATDKGAKVDDSTFSTIRGVAQDAKMGACLMVDDMPYYLTGLDAWPSDVIGRKVEVRGIIEVEDRLGIAKSKYSAGVSGNYHVIKKSDWHLCPD